MESFFGGSPWDFGTGFLQPPTFGAGGSLPVMPQTDLAQGFAQQIAAQGIRPDQFMANPGAAMQNMQPQGTPSSAGSNPWDPTPVDTPGGPPVSLGGRTSENPNIQTDDPAQASAEGTPADAAAGKQKGWGEKLAETLKGVKAPTPPTPQTVRTPSAPDNRHTIKAGELLSMLLSMQTPSAQAGLKLPSTLGAAAKGIF